MNAPTLVRTIAAVIALSTLATADPAPVPAAPAAPAPAVPASASAAPAASPAPAPVPLSPAAAPAVVTKLDVFPSDLNLSSARDRQSIVAQATFADGLTRDVTAESVITPANPGLLRRDGSTYYPVADGATTLNVTYSGTTVTIPVKVEHAAVDPPLSFRLDVMPVFMKAGCNTGSCHGAARGKDGFRLSLFGFDPAGDHFRLTREMSGRRVNLAVPAREHRCSRRPPASVQHTGGKKIRGRERAVQDLAPLGRRGRVRMTTSRKLPKVVAVELYPRNGVLDGKGSRLSR